MWPKYSVVPSFYLPSPLHCDIKSQGTVQSKKQGGKKGTGATLAACTIVPVICMAVSSPDALAFHVVTIVTAVVTF